jgi:hypothetical protein
MLFVKRVREWRPGDLWISFWLANFFLIQDWDEAIKFSSNAINYYRGGPSANTLAATTLLNAVVLTLLVWSSMRLVRITKRPWLTIAARTGFMLAFIVPARHILNAWVRPHVGDTASLVMQRTFEAAVIASIVLLIVYRISVGVRIGKAVTTIFVPIMAFNMFCVWLWSGEPVEAYAAQTPAAAAHLRSSPRLVWIILDEMDERLAFEKRPASVELPELERLRGEAIYGSNVRSPAGWTNIAVPSLTTGRDLRGTNPVAPGELELTFRDGTRGRWSEQRTIFTEARAMGFDTGLAGWTHPYCRVLGSQLTECFWQENDDMFNSMSKYHQARHWGMLSAMGAQMIHVMERLPVIRRTRFVRNLAGKLTRLEVRLVKKQQIAAYERLMSAARRMASNASLGLVFIHLNVPHPVGIYSRTQNDVSVSDDVNYVDNLELADRAVGELRSAMEKAALWQSTTVLLTSDHPLRADLWSETAGRWSTEEAALTGNRTGDLVPFLLKLAGQKKGLEYKPAFNNLLAHDLSLAVLSGDIDSPEDAVAWLDKNRERSPSLPKPEQVHLSTWDKHN